MDKEELLAKLEFMPDRIVLLAQSSIGHEVEIRQEFRLSFNSFQCSCLELQTYLELVRAELLEKLLH